MRRFAFDTETFLIAEERVTPPIVCGSFAWRHEGEIQSELYGNHPDDALDEKIETLLDMVIEGEAEIVTHNGGFDWVVVMSSYEHLIPKVFLAMLTGRLIDTLWREKLLNLSTTGKLTAIYLPDGSKKSIMYSLSALEKDYLGIDRSDQKEGDDIWRLAYSELDGWLASEYPDDAADYAKEDAEGTLAVSEAQDERAAQWEGVATLATQGFQLAASIALQLMTSWGMKTDPEAIDEMERQVIERIAAVEPTLIEAGLLRPAEAPRPHANQKKRVEAALAELGGTWEDHVEELKARGVKFTAGKKSSKDMKAMCTRSSARSPR